MSFSPKMLVAAGNYSIGVQQSKKDSFGPTLLFVHGIGVSSRYFLPFAKECAKQYNILLVDLPGYGTAPKPDHPLTIPELADVLLTYLKEANVPRVIVIGQSMGCQIAAHMAVKQPEVCEQLILIGPTVNKWERNVFTQSLRLLQDIRREPGDANFVVFKDYLRMGPLRYLRTVQYMIADHIERTLHTCDTPTLIVRGSQDVISPKRWNVHLAQQMKHATAKEISNAPHLVQLAKPQELLSLCQDFIDSPQPSRAIAKPKHTL
ncbi:MAG TPA: alpha/beta hydrolase [Candidatus Saccharimonadales bacterium]